MNFDTLFKTNVVFTLWCTDNNLLTETIPAAIWQLPNMSEIYLFNNQLSGSISTPVVSPAIDAGPWLQFVDIANNLLTGFIPESLFNSRWSNVQYFYAYNNQFTGSIPRSIGNLTGAVILDLSDNSELSGSMPIEIFTKCLSLEEISITGTSLTGSIPNEIMNLRLLQYLYLDNNELVGSIPAALWQMPSLENLYLDRNKLSGSITVRPASEKYPIPLLTVFLSLNNLTGSIPEELFSERWSNVQAFLASGNRFVGSIPNTTPLGNKFHNP